MKQMESARWALAYRQESYEKYGIPILSYSMNYHPELDHTDKIPNRRIFLVNLYTMAQEFGFTSLRMDKLDEFDVDAMVDVTRGIVYDPNVKRALHTAEVINNIEEAITTKSRIRDYPNSAYNVLRSALLTSDVIVLSKNDDFLALGVARGVFAHLLMALWALLRNDNTMRVHVSQAVGKLNNEYWRAMLDMVCRRFVVGEEVNLREKEDAPVVEFYFFVKNRNKVIKIVEIIQEMQFDSRYVYDLLNTKHLDKDVGREWRQLFDLMFEKEHERQAMIVRRRTINATRPPSSSTLWRRRLHKYTAIAKFVNGDVVRWVYQPPELNYRPIKRALPPEHHQPIKRAHK